MFTALKLWWLSRQMQSTDAVVRRAAIRSLATIPGEQAARALAGALHDADAEVRRLAVATLDPATTAGIDQLLQALTDPETGVQEAAAAGLLRGDTIRGLRGVAGAIAGLSGETTTALFQAVCKKNLSELSRPERREILQTILGHPGEVATNLMLATLRDGAPVVRMQLAEDVEILGADRAVGPLVAALADPEEHVRWWAAQTLGRLRDSRAVDGLVTALSDPKGLVALSAASALGDIRDPRAVEPLITALRDEKHPARGSAAIALGEMGDPRAIPALLMALGATTANLAGYAFKSLTRLKQAGGYEAVVEAFQRQLPASPPLVQVAGLLASWAAEGDTRAEGVLAHAYLYGNAERRQVVEKLIQESGKSAAFAQVMEETGRVMRTPGRVDFDLLGKVTGEMYRQQMQRQPLLPWAERILALARSEEAESTAEADSPPDGEVIASLWQEVTAKCLSGSTSLVFRNVLAGDPTTAAPMKIICDFFDHFATRTAAIDVSIRTLPNPGLLESLELESDLIRLTREVVRAHEAADVVMAAASSGGPKAGVFLQPIGLLLGAVEKKLQEISALLAARPNTTTDAVAAPPVAAAPPAPPPPVATPGPGAAGAMQQILGAAMAGANQAILDALQQGKVGSADAGALLGAVTGGVLQGLLPAAPPAPEPLAASEVPPTEPAVRTAPAVTWATCAHPQLGFQFDYPQGWVNVPGRPSIIYHPPDARSLVSSEGGKEQEIFSPALTLMMLRRGKTAGQSPAQVYDDFKQRLPSHFPDYTCLDEHPVRLPAGQEAMQITFDFHKAGHAFRAVLVYLVQPNAIFILDGSGMTDDFRMVEPVLRQSVASLRVKT